MNEPAKTIEIQIQISNFHHKSDYKNGLSSDKLRSDFSFQCAGEVRRASMEYLRKNFVGRWAD